METVAVIDYGMSNLHSVVSAVQHVYAGEVIATSDVKLIDNADKIVFPGQGAAADCMAHIRQYELIDVIARAMETKPFLGICMGLQVLLSHSEENDGTPCLDYFPGEVRSFQQSLQALGIERKIPHMGWNQIQKKMDHPLWHNIENDSYFYFVHSYYVDPSDTDVVAGETEYGLVFPSVIAKDNIFAMQCHPEKSADAGLQMLKNFVQWNGRQ